MTAADGLRRNAYHYLTKASLLVVGDGGGGRCLSSHVWADRWSESHLCGLSVCCLLSRHCCPCGVVSQANATASLAYCCCCCWHLATVCCVARWRHWRSTYINLKRVIYRQQTISHQRLGCTLRAARLNDAISGQMYFILLNFKSCRAVGWSYVNMKL